MVVPISWVTLQLNGPWNTECIEFGSIMIILSWTITFPHWIFERFGILTYCTLATIGRFVVFLGPLFFSIILENIFIEITKGSSKKWVATEWHWLWTNLFSFAWFSKLQELQELPESAALAPFGPLQLHLIFCAHAGSSNGAVSGSRFMVIDKSSVRPVFIKLQELQEFL